MIKKTKIKTYLLLFTILLAVSFLRLFVFEVKRVTDWQMYPGFYQNDFYILNKLDKSPQRGGLYYFEATDSSPAGLYRVVAVEGDSVKYWAGRYWLNGESVNQDLESVSHLPFGKSAGVDLSDISYMKWLKESLESKQYSVIAFESGTKENFAEDLVPEKKLFVLKDFRAFGKDSRGFGFLSEDKIRGRASVVLYSCTKLFSKNLSICDFFKFRKGRFFTRIP